VVLELRPVSGALGAEVVGVDLRGLDEQGAAEVREALHAQEVLFFRAAHLSVDEQLAVGRALGEVSIFPLARVRGATEPTVQVIEDGPDSPPTADYWHTDVTWCAEPPNYAVL
jgi:taurine dioxygenase